MLIAINIVAIIALFLLIVYIIQRYSRSMLFDISILWWVLVYIVPLTLSAVNVGYLYVHDPQHLWYGFFPLGVIAIFEIVLRWQNILGHRLYTKVNHLIKDLEQIAASYGAFVSSDDIRIRIGKSSKFTIIFNAYSDHDELKLRAGLDDCKKLLDKNFPRNQVEILIDRKRYGRS